MFERTKKSVIKAIEGKNKKAGIFWHTQGSGKSYSMVMLAKNIINIKRRLTVLIITDRTDLDEQIYQTFSKSKSYLNQEIKQIGSIQDLKDTLKNKIQNGIYFSTVQKFNKNVKTLSNRDDILIIVDEAHRSHSNIEIRYISNSETMSIEEKFGNAAYLRQAFPHATFVGFTGTPIEKDDFATINIFGRYITKYLMSDATKGWFCCPN